MTRGWRLAVGCAGAFALPFVLASAFLLTGAVALRGSDNSVGMAFTAVLLAGLGITPAYLVLRSYRHAKRVEAAGDQPWRARTDWQTRSIEGGARQPRSGLPLGGTISGQVETGMDVGEAPDGGFVVTIGCYRRFKTTDAEGDLSGIYRSFLSGVAFLFGSSPSSIMGGRRRFERRLENEIERGGGFGDRLLVAHGMAHRDEAEWIAKRIEDEIRGRAPSPEALPA